MCHGGQNLLNFHSYPSSHNHRGAYRRVKRSCFGKQFLFSRDMQWLARDGYTYYPMKDPMDHAGLSGMCSKNATSMPPPLCIRSSQDLFRWTPRCMAVTSSTIFITHANKTSWVHDGLEPLILSMIRVTHDYYHYWYMFRSPNQGTKEPLRGWQEWDVSGPVRFTMLGLSRVNRENGKCSFVNKNVCTNAYDTYMEYYLTHSNIQQ